MRFAVWQGESYRGSECGHAVRLLVTRPGNEAQKFASALRQRGHDSVIAPLLQVRFEAAGGPVDLAGVQAVLATSANGVRALVARSGERRIPLYAVGHQTAETARIAGFAEVISADGDSTALAAKVAEHCDPAGGRLLHAAGADTAGRLEEALKAHGFQIDTIVLYVAVPVETLPAQADSFLRSDALDGVLLFSPRTARVFAALVARAGLSSHCETITAFCISRATAAALSPLRFARIAVAANPNRAAMLNLLRPPGVQQ